MITQYLTVSTIHVPQDFKSYTESYITAEGMYTTYLYVPEFMEPNGTEPSWLINLMRYARDTGCQYIALDPCGTEYESFEKFEW